MKRLMIIGLWPDDAVNYCTEKCDAAGTHSTGCFTTGEDELPASASASR